MTSNHYARRMAVFYAALFLIYGLHLPFFPVWLRARGIDIETISWIIAVPLCLRVLINPFIANIADRTKSYKPFIVVIAVMSFAIAMALTQFINHGFIIAASIAFALAFTAVMPLTETITVTGVRSFNLHYGRVRLWGSLSFIFASFIGGAIIDNAGNESIIWILCAAALVTAMATNLLPNISSSLTRTASAPTNSLQTHSPQLPENLTTLPDSNLKAHDAKSFLKSKQFILFLMCGGLAQASHATYYAYGTIHWLDQDISPLWVGVLWAIGVIAEIVLFMYSSTIASKISPSSLMTIGALGGLIRWLAMAFDPSFATLIPLQILHGLTYGATHLGAIHFIAQIVPENKTATAQALYGGVGNGIAMAFATLISGWLFAKFASLTYFAMAALSLVATMAGILNARTWPRPNDINT